MSESYTKSYFKDIQTIAHTIDIERIDTLVKNLSDLRDRKGRLFVIGVGGSAGNAGHAVNDFRKLCHIEAYAPTDNVSELTARANDEGWESIFRGWLEVSNLCARDAILVFSVGGGDRERNISTNIIAAIDLARDCGAMVLGIVGNSKGYTARNGDTVVVIPEINLDKRTPYSEAYQAVVWHCLVSHPALQSSETKW